MKVWVSGTAGTLGSEVRRQLLAGGYDAVAADLRGERPVDLEDPAAVARSMAGCEAVIHCAGIPSPEGVAPADLVRVNTMTTFNALEEAWRAGIRCAVLASSGSIYGTAWGPSDLRQPYLPVDEDSPLQYVDPYALTKDLVERMGRMYARRGMTVTALRFHWILPPDQLRELARRVPDDEQVHNLWGYVTLADAARACLLALAPRTGAGRYEVCVIAAEDTLARTPTRELLDTYTPESVLVRDIDGNAGCFDLSRAEAVLGWRPESVWRA